MISYQVAGMQVRWFAHNVWLQLMASLLPHATVKQPTQHICEGLSFLPFHCIQTFYSAVRRLAGVVFYNMEKA
jgi:hypothetical protein